MKQFQITLSAKSKGFHLVTDEILDHLTALPEKGLLHLFCQHTSAALCINENADPDVLHDLNAAMDDLIKENKAYYRHTYEGSDDMPAHIKSVMLGPDLLMPVRNHRLALGTWQGIYLGEFRNHGGPRKIIATVL